jgi:aryl-alcohol dehydrogenase-like predicted oxidoreductase
MNFGEQCDEVNAHAQLDYALDQGIDFFDTAEVYPVPPKPETAGATERIIGNWLASRRNRDKVIVATKIAGRSQRSDLRPDNTPPEINRKHVVMAVEGSLQRLKTDYIDLYQLHWPDRPVALFGASPFVFSDNRTAEENAIRAQLEALAEVMKAGKVRAIGLSNETPWGAMRFVTESELHGLPRMAAIQNCYNLLNRTYEIGLAEIGLREDVGLLAYSPLGQGFLSGKYQNGALPPGARRTLFNRQQRYERPAAVKAVAEYLRIARDFGLDPSQMALAYVTSRPFVASNIIGATTMQQLRTDIASRDVKITPEIEARIDAVHHALTNPAF